MSSIVISGNTSGTVTLSAPDVSGTTVLTLPTTSGTVITTGSTFAGNGPAFSAYAGSATSLGNGVSTKVLFNTEEFDTNSNYDTSLSRFTPTIAGYYQVTSSINTAAYISSNSQLVIHKNGSNFKVGLQFGNSGNTAGVTVEALIYMNGSTDYLEIYAYHGSGGSVNTNANATSTYFQAVMVRSA